MTHTLYSIVEMEHESLATFHLNFNSVDFYILELCSASLNLLRSIHAERDALYAEANEEYFDFKQLKLLAHNKRYSKSIKIMCNS